MLFCGLSNKTWLRSGVGISSVPLVSNESTINTSKFLSKYQYNMMDALTCLHPTGRIPGSTFYKQSWLKSTFLKKLFAPHVGYPDYILHIVLIQYYYFFFLMACSTNYRP